MNAINKINNRLNNEHFWFLCNFFSMLEMALCFIIAGRAVVVNNIIIFLIFLMLMFLMAFVTSFLYIEMINTRIMKS